MSEKLNTKFNVGAFKGKSIFFRGNWRVTKRTRCYIWIDISDVDNADEYHSYKKRIYINPKRCPAEYIKMGNDHFCSCFLESTE